MKKGTSVLIFSVFALSIAGCSGSGAAGKASPSEGQKEPAFKMTTDPIEIFITSTSGDSKESFDDRFLDLVKGKFPTVKFTYLPWVKNGPGPAEMLAAGQQIDMYYDSIGSFKSASFGLEMDMTNLVKKHGLDLSTLEPSTVDGGKILSGGKELWGVPVFNINMILYYNKDIFDKFGVPYPKKEGMTWDDLYDIAKKVSRSDGDKRYSGYTTSNNHLLRLNQLSLPYIDQTTGKSTINSDAWKKWYQTAYIAPYAASYYDDWISVNGNRVPNFLKGEAAMWYNLSNSIFVSKEYETMNWDIVPAPTMKEKPGVGSQAYPNYFSVTKTAKYPEEAMEIIKFLVSDEAQMKMSRKGVMPVSNKDEVKKAFGADSKFKDKNLPAVFTNKFAPIAYYHKDNGIVEASYVNALYESRTGDINTALRKAEEDANKKLAEQPK